MKILIFKLISLIGEIFFILILFAEISEILHFNDEAIFWATISLIIKYSFKLLFILEEITEL